MSEPPSEFTADEARHFGEQIGIDWSSSPFDVEQFLLGMNIELEQPPGRLHQRQRRRPQVTAKIALRT